MGLVHGSLSSLIYIFKILAQFTPVQLLQAIREDWNLFINQYSPAAIFQALHDARLDLSQIIKWVYNMCIILGIWTENISSFSNIYTKLTIEELLQHLNPLYHLNEIVAGFAQVSNSKDTSKNDEWGLKHWI